MDWKFQCNWFACVLWFLVQKGPSGPFPMWFFWSTKQYSPIAKWYKPGGLQYCCQVSIILLIQAFKPRKKCNKTNKQIIQTNYRQLPRNYVARDITNPNFLKTLFLSVFFLFYLTKLYLCKTYLIHCQYFLHPTNQFNI